MTTAASIKPRVAKFRPFISLFGALQRGGGIAVGGVTYGTNENGEETYQISKVELGLRSDHIVDAVNSLQGNEVAARLVSDSGSDVEYVGTVQQNETAKAKQAEATAKQRAADAKAARNGKSDDDAPVLAVA